MKLFFKVQMFLCILATTTMASPLRSEMPCPPFWVPFQESCYRIFGEKVSWTEAERNCNGYFNKVAMGHLVSIRSVDENKFVSILWNSATGSLSTHFHYHTYWIGLNDIDQEGNFVWTDNNEVATYANWYPENPSNDLGNEDCVHVLNHNDPDKMMWNDKVCTHKVYYVCELPQVPVTV